MTMLYVFDMDGTLRVTKSGRPCPNDPSDQEILPGVRERLFSLKKEGNTIACATNQGGVSCGYMSKETSEEINEKTNSLLSNVIERIAVSYYHETGIHRDMYLSPRPKPLPDMMYDLARWYNLSFQRDSLRPYMDAVFVGDSYTDRDFSANSHVDFVWAHEFFAFEACGTDYGFSYAPWLELWKIRKARGY